MLDVEDIEEDREEDMEDLLDVGEDIMDMELPSASDAPQLFNPNCSNCSNCSMDNEGLIPVSALDFLTGTFKFFLYFLNMSSTFFFQRNTFFCLPFMFEFPLAG